MKKPKIRKIEIKDNEVKIRYSVSCPICNKEINGTKASQVEFNLETHIRSKHKDGN